MENYLSKTLKGNVVIVGLGNRLKSDDSAGSLLIDRIKDKVNVKVIDAGIALENFTKPIISMNPDVVLLFDAVDLGKKPGTIEEIKINDINAFNFSTHGLHIKFFFEYLLAHGVKKIIIIGIQPKSVELGEAISKPVNKAIDNFIEILEKILEKGNKI